MARGPGEILTALFSPEGRADPYPLYAALHEIGEAVEAPGAVVVAGYDAVNMVLRDPSFTVADGADFDRELAGWREHSSLADFMLSILSANSPERRVSNRGRRARESRRARRWAASRRW